MKESIPGTSARLICKVLHISRSVLFAKHPKKDIRKDEELLPLIKELIQQHPTYGYRRIWALIAKGRNIQVNKKKIYRIFKENRLFVCVRSTTPRPRVQAKKSVASESNERWALDITHIYCGKDGWGHLVGVIDCHDRELIGYEFALRGRAREAERAIEDACIKRFGTLKIEGRKPVVRSDNGLVFISRRFRSACKDYNLDQEFITPYTPEQNGIIERFFRSLKEECVWQQSFGSFEEARRAIVNWIEWYNTKRPHQSLHYLSPEQFRNMKYVSVA